jgi:hypothetical protein
MTVAVLGTRPMNCTVSKYDKASRLYYLLKREAMDSITSCVKVCPIPAEPIKAVGFIAGKISKIKKRQM